MARRLCSDGGHLTACSGLSGKPRRMSPPRRPRGLGLTRSPALSGPSLRRGPRLRVPLGRLGRWPSSRSQVQVHAGEHARLEARQHVLLPQGAWNPPVPGRPCLSVLVTRYCSIRPSGGTYLSLPGPAPSYLRRPRPGTRRVDAICFSTWKRRIDPAVPVIRAARNGNAVGRYIASAGRLFLSSATASRDHASTRSLPHAALSCPTRAPTPPR